jgi:hypothetical protein
MPRTIFDVRRRTRSFPLAGILGCLPLLGALLGCLEAGTTTEATHSDYAHAVAVPYAAKPAVIVERGAIPEAPADAAMAGMRAPASPMSPPAEGATDSPFAGEEPSPAANSALSRKIIYNADLALAVEDFGRVEPEVSRLVQTHQGYIASQEVLGSPGERRSARWTIRVPVETFEAFLVEVARLGELERNTRTSQDVSEQFYDIEARVKNKQVEEAQLLKLLEERVGALEEILKVEAELSRVRGEIEQLQGRLRVLTNLTSLTTVTLAIRERERFQPPPPVVASFPTRLSRTFQASLRNFIEFSQILILILVSWIPWIPVLLLGVLVSWWVGRRLVRLLARGGRRAWEVARTPISPPPAS